MESGDRAALVRICDQAGRTRGTGFLADDRGTVVTSHEAVAGLTRLVLHGAQDRAYPVEADGITALPEHGLALLHGPEPGAFGLEPLPIAARDRVEPGTYVTIAAHGTREARVLGTAPAAYTEHGRSHRLPAVLELALGTDGSDALRLGGAAVGGPVIDPESGAVLGVLGNALRAEHPAAGFAVPLVPAGADGPLAELLHRNATRVPGYGRDLNLAGALQLTATSIGSAGGPAPWSDPVERPDVTAEFSAFAAAALRHPPDGTPVVLGLVGAPGTGRTTELAALAARRSLGAVPALTLWLRGADLLADDTSVADAVARTLRQAGRIVAAAGAPGDMTRATPERVARLAGDSGSPLLVLLDGPEEMPPVLAHRLARWTGGTVDWLRAAGARLVVACRPEHWETAGALCPPDALYRPARPARRLPPAVRLGRLTAEQAGRARERYALPPGALAPGHDRHPLTLRLLAEVREALPGDVPGAPDTEDVFTAHLDLMCLRVAVRIAAEAGPAPGGRAVKRLAARVAGQVHEAARRCLGPGQGELDRAAFEEVFPWRTGWASAVLAEGLLVPAGSGYRFAHEELGDWVQGAHLDVDAALRALVHRWHARRTRDAGERDRGGAEGAGSPGGGDVPRGDERVPRPRQPRTGPDRGAGTDARSAASAAPAAAASAWAPPSVPASDADPAEPRSLPVPHHRIGPVVQALLLLGRRQGPSALAHRLADLIEALDRLSAAPCEPSGEESGEEDAAGAGQCPDEQAPEHDAGHRSGASHHPEGGGRPRGDATWWAAHLLFETLSRVPDARPHLGVLRLLAGRIVRRATAGHGPAGLGPYAELGPWFWRRLRLPEADRIDLLRRLMPADALPAGEGARSADSSDDGDGERYLDAVTRRLAARPHVVQPLLCDWFTDERPLAAGTLTPSASAPPPTVADAAQALLHARRHLAIDELTDALASTRHPRAEELLSALAEEEPAALCRAVHRWAHDEDRPDRRAAAAVCVLTTDPHATREADRDLLRHAAVALLTRPADAALHGPALTFLVRDPRTRERCLPRALRAFVTGEPCPDAAGLAVALTSHPGPVLTALRDRLTRPEGGAGEMLCSLASIDAPAFALHAAGLVRAYIDSHPDDAAHPAAYIDLRLEQGSASRALLLPLVTGLLREPAAPAAVRCGLARVLAAPGSPSSAPARGELLEVLLDFEQSTGRSPRVLDALLRAAATGSAARAPARTRALVHRTGMLLARTPEGAAHFDRRLTELARDVPGFGALVSGWLADAPQEWAALIGPGARHALDVPGAPMTMPMQAAGREHGSLRPA